MMIHRQRVFQSIAIFGVVFAAVSCATLAAQTPNPPDSERKLLSDFSSKAKQYIDTEHSLAADKMKPTTDVAKLEQQRRQLREAMQQARPNAKQGDFFSPPTAQVIRRLLANLFKGTEGAKIKASLDHAEPGAPAQFKVNGEFPNQNGQPIQSVPPTILKVLPALPKGLEYCIAGNTLALRDASANMVVDILPNAIP